MDIAGAILSIIGIFFNIKKSIWCWPIWFLGSVLLLIHSFLLGQIFLCIVFACYILSDIYGWYVWNKDEKERLKHIYGDSYSDLMTQITFEEIDARLENFNDKPILITVYNESLIPMITERYQELGWEVAVVNGEDGKTFLEFS